MSDSDNGEKVKGTLIPNLQPPQSMQAVHVDKVLVTTQPGSEVATLTLLQMHVIPDRKREGFTLENLTYSIVGELKVPLSVMNELAVYYIHELTGGLDVVPIMQEYIKEHGKDEPYQRLNFGPPGDLVDARQQKQQ